MDCVYCFGRGNKEPTREDRIRIKSKLYKDSYAPGYAPQSVSFSGGGEPLLYLPVIEEYMQIFKEIEPRMQGKPWYYLYTNGLLATKSILRQLKDLGFNEIRFHLGASDFSNQVLRHLEEATRYFQAVTVETPTWPPHRTKLFAMLPVLHDLGVRHLNLGEIELTKANITRILEVLPDAEIYQCHEIHLYDGGLAYDLIEEVVAKGYSYSVLDCSSFVKCIQRGPGKNVHHESLNGLIAQYP
ncbi:MAG: hypothetical protein HQK56_07690 [Deltaproteobacteria bacterium]|nr:hypothetical protein [Deltaproteobacteria bacterium]